MHPSPFAPHSPPPSSSIPKDRTLKSVHAVVQHTEAADASLCLFTAVCNSGADARADVSP